MYLVDTNIISELRKKNPNKGVKKFFTSAQVENNRIFISVITLGELRRGVELIRYRGDIKQANSLEAWLQQLVDEYSDYFLSLTPDIAQVWGKLRIPRYENALDKQIAATALIYNLILVTRNTPDFEGMGVELLNPFETIN